MIPFISPRALRGSGAHSLRHSRKFQRGAISLPWWAWVALAGISFFLLGGLAQGFDPAHAPGVISGTVASASSSLSPTVRGWLHMIAQVVQYAAPFVMLVVAGLRFGHRNDGNGTQSKNIVQQPRNSGEEKNRMSWGQFELLTLEVFRRRGYRMSERGNAASDGSMNLEVQKDAKKYVVHCKQWRAKEVSMGVVRELNSMMIVSNSAGGFIVTSGAFSADVRAFVAGRNIQLIDGATMREMLRDPATLAQFEEASVMPTGIVTNAPTLR